MYKEERMAKIKSSVEAAQEAVKPLLDLELPKFEKIELEYSNVDALVKGAKINNELGELMAEYEKVVKNFARQVVAMAEKKEQDDKKDALSFSSAMAEGSSRQSSRKETLKDRLTKKTDWQKYGREHLEDAGVYFKQDGSGYVIDGAKAVENIVKNGAEKSFDIYKEGIDERKKSDKAYGHLFENQLKDSPAIPNKPDFDPNPNR